MAASHVREVGEIDMRRQVGGTGMDQRIHRTFVRQCLKTVARGPLRSGP